MIKAIVLDEDLESSAHLISLLEDSCKGIEVIGNAATIKEAHNLIEQNDVTIVFMDIYLEGTSTFDLLEKYKSKDFYVVFVASNSDYALKAIKYSAVDYILKPITIDELQAPVEKVKEREEHKTLFQEKMHQLIKKINSPQEKIQRLALPTINGFAFINIKDIVYCKGKGNYTVVHTRNGEKYIAAKSLKEYETILVSHDFFRIHKSYLINLNEITEYVNGTEDKAVMSNNDALVVSKRKIEIFSERIMVIKGVLE